MNNPNNPRGQTPNDDMKKKKPMGDQMGQKAQRPGDKDNLSEDLDGDKNKSNDMKKDKMSDQGQTGQRKH